MYRGVIGSEREDITRGWRKLHNAEHCNSRSSREVGFRHGGMFRKCCEGIDWI
jgi:hypothetical protein